MNDLDWLARNVHEWPCAKYQTIKRNGDSFAIYTSGYVTYSQWLTRRAELQNKPGWEMANPDEFYRSQDIDGLWAFHRSEPSFDGVGWWSGQRRSVCLGKVLGDPINTIERRPERKPSDKTAKALEEASNMSKQWSGPEDGLPPVGMECESHLSGSLWEIGCLTYIGNNLIVWKSHTGHEYATRLTDRVFRPLRTEEDKAVEDLVSLIQRVANNVYSEINGSTADAVARVIVSKSYRKIERESGDE